MNQIPFNAETQRTRRNAERWNRKPRSADSHVRVTLFDHQGLADMVVRAPGLYSSFREPLRSPRFCGSAANLFPNDP